MIARAYCTFPSELVAFIGSPYALSQEKLFGRESELKTLLSAFERVSCLSTALLACQSHTCSNALQTASAGRSEVVFVAGEGGSGKSRLVAELHAPITKRRGVFASGKFDQFNRSPFHAFCSASSSLLLRSQLLNSCCSCVVRS